MPTLYHLTMRPKRYADEPVLPQRRPHKMPPAASLPRRFSVSGSLAQTPSDTMRVCTMRGSIGLRPELILFSDLTASQHKEYHVIKLRGTSGVTREGRVLGIDRERILNLLPRGGNGGGSVGSGLLGGIFERTTTSKPVHYIRDVQLLQVDEDDNRRFHIAYINPQGGLDRYEFEADSPLECAEIVAKINHLIALHQKGKR
jgi:hypothetical protein